jgi:hypothetical protein
MDSKKVKKFIQLAGTSVDQNPKNSPEKLRALGAQLLLSETLEYVIKGLGVSVKFNGVEITDPNGLEYTSTKVADPNEMLDGLADVAYTMFWNAVTFGMPLEQAYELVADNNLEKFVALTNWTKGEGDIANAEWNLGQNISWPKEVVRVQVIKIGNEFFGVGKDASGKVRKPSSYKSVELDHLLSV